MAVGQGLSFGRIMGEYKDTQPITDKVQIVLTGPDGKVKEDKIVEGNNETRKGHGIQNRLRNKGLISPRT